MKQFRTDSELDAFCIDYFPEVIARFSSKMERTEKINQLLLIEVEEQILDALEHHRSGTSSAAQRAPIEHAPPSMLMGPAAADMTAPRALQLNTLPPANRWFLDRDELKAKATGLLHTHGGVVLKGLAGTGKTQLALAIAHDLASQGAPLVAWIDATQPASVELPLLEVAGKLRLKGVDAADPMGGIAALKRYLSTTRDAVLVVDGATDLEHLRGLLFDGTYGRILVTTRRADAVLLGLPTIETPPFTEEEALTFLQERSDCPEHISGERETARSLVRELGCLPFALEQVTRDLHANRVSVSSYLEQFRQYGVRQLHQPVPPLLAPHQAQTIQTLWKKDLESLKRYPASYHVLIICSLWPLGPFPVGLLSEHAGRLSPMIDVWLSSTGERALDRLLEPLLAASLIHRHTQSATLSVHPLVQAVVKDLLTPSEREQFVPQVARVLTSVLHEMTPLRWSHLESSWPALRSLCHEVLLIDRDEPTALWNTGHHESHALCDVVRTLLGQQAYARDESMELIRARKAIHMKSHTTAAQIEVVKHWHYEAQLHSARDEYGRAIDCMRWAKEGIQGLIGRANNAGWATGLVEVFFSNRLLHSALLSGAGQWNQAVDLLASPPDLANAGLRDTAWTKQFLILELDQLCELLLDQERFLEADGHATKLLGLHDLQLLSDRNAASAYREALRRVADGYLEQQKFGRAAQTLMHLLQWGVDSFCPFSELLDAWATLDKLYRTQTWPQRSEYAAASAAFQNQLAQVMADLDRQPTSVLVILARFTEDTQHVHRFLDLARAAEKRRPDGEAEDFRFQFGLRLRKTDWEFAEQLLEEHLALLGQTLRPGHPKLAHMHGTIAQLLNDAAWSEKEQHGRINQILLARAIAKYEVCIDMLDQTYSPAHAETLRMLCSRAKQEARQGLYEQATKTLLKAQSRCERYGREFPELADVLTDMASVALEAGQFSEAEQRARQAVAICHRHVGEGHPRSIDAEENLAAIWQEQSKAGDAYELLRKTLAQRETVWGTDHPLLADSLERLVELSEKMGKPEDAQSLRERARALHEAK